uniref:Thioredoxin reductase n=1 Tax=Panagrolaimus sp. JU765 TaxID=591449 RepID=A0AC34QVS2_9BILA
MAYVFKQYMRVLGKWPKDTFKSNDRNLLYFMERELERVFKYNQELPEAALCERRLKAHINRDYNRVLSHRGFCTTSDMPPRGIEKRCLATPRAAALQVAQLAAEQPVTIVIPENTSLDHEISKILQPHCASEKITVELAQVDEPTATELLKTVGFEKLPLIYLRGNCIGGLAELKALQERGYVGEFVKKHEYDLIVIGGGSGGLAAAKEAGKRGKKVACLDFVKPTPLGTTWGLGGTCVNVGCIPKKLMHQGAILGESIHDAKKFGWEIPKGEIKHDWKKMQTAIADYIGGLNWGYKTALRTAGVKYLNSYGVFTGSHEITATSNSGAVEKLTADKFLVAVGLRPRYPDVPGAKEYCITSDDLFYLPYNPGKTLCIGASYVSLECAGFLRGIGNDVSVMVRSILLRGFDTDMAERIGKHMKKKGIKFLNAVPVRFEQLKERTETEPGRIKVHFKLVKEDGTSEEASEEFDTVLLAIGRDAKTEDLGLDKIGAKLSKAGKLICRVDQNLTMPNIYAVGDVLDGCPELTPVAIHAGRALVRRVFTGNLEVTEYWSVPTTVFTPLEYGCCGMSEDDAIKKFGKDNIVIYHNVFYPLEYTVPERNDDMESCYLKLICIKESERVIGFHILTPNAGEITQGFGIALKMNATKADFDRLIGIHPTVAENFTTLNVVRKEGEELEASGC